MFIYDGGVEGGGGVRKREIKEKRKEGNKGSKEEKKDEKTKGRRRKIRNKK